MRADTAHTAPNLTETAAPDSAVPTAVGNGKRNSDCARPTDGQTASTSPHANQDSDVMLVVSIGESDGESDYVELDKNSPTSLANTPDLEGHISELEEKHEVAEGDLVELTRPTMIFFHIDNIKLPDLDDAKTDLPEKNQDNGALVPVNTQPSLPHSPLEDSSVASAAPP